MTNFKDILTLIKENKIANRFVNILSIDVIVKGSNILLIPVYLHILSQHQIGVFNYAFAFIQTMSAIFNFGLYIAQSKLYHDFDSEKRKELLFSIHLIFIVLLILFLVPIYLFKLDYSLANLVFNNQLDYHSYRFLILFSIIISSGSYMLLNYFLTSENIKRVQLYNLFRFILSNGIVILILLNTISDKVFIRLISFYSIEFCIYLFFASRYFVNSKICFNQYYISKILYLSLPAFFLSIISTVQAFSDKFFIQLQSSNMSIIAVYTLGTTIAAILGLIIQSFQSIWLPLFFKEKNVQENFRLTKKLVSIIVVGFSILSIFLFLGVKGALIFNIIPSEYHDVIYILPFLLLSQIILGVNTIFSNYFSYFEKVYLGAITGSLIYLISFGLNFLLIPRYGVPGAIISLLIGNLILLSLVYMIIKSLYKKSLSNNISNI